MYHDDAIDESYEKMNPEIMNSFNAVKEGSTLLMKSQNYIQHLLNICFLLCDKCPNHCDANKYPIL